jgi:hypothetical protein
VRDRSETTLEDSIAVSLLFFNRAIIAVIHDVLQHLALTGILVTT